MANGIINRMPARGRPMAPVTSILPYPNPFLGLLPSGMWNRVKDYFTYARDFVNANALAAAGTQQLTIQINNDSDFLVVSSTGVVTLTDNTTFVAQPPILVTIEDSGSGRQLQAQQVHWLSYFGTGQEPKYWDMTKIIPAASTIQISLQNLDAVNAFHARVYLHGFKVFPFTPSS